MLGLLALGLAACVPARFSGYQPRGVGSLEGGYCVGGIRDVLRVELADGAQLLWHARMEGTPQELYLYVTLVVPHGTTLRLLSPYVSLTGPAWPGGRTLQVRRIAGPGEADLPPQVDLAGPVQADRAAAMFTVSFMTGSDDAWGRTGLVPGNRFSASLAPLSVNGRTLAPDPVAFERYRRWGWYYCVQ